MPIKPPVAQRRAIRRQDCGRIGKASGLIPQQVKKRRKLERRLFALRKVGPTRFFAKSDFASRISRAQHISAGHGRARSAYPFRGTSRSRWHDGAPHPRLCRRGDGSCRGRGGSGRPAGACRGVAPAPARRGSGRRCAHGRTGRHRPRYRRADGEHGRRNRAGASTFRWRACARSRALSSWPSRSKARPTA